MELDYSKYKIHWPRSIYRGVDVSIFLNKSVERTAIKLDYKLCYTQFSLIFYFSDLNKFNLQTRILALNIISKVWSDPPRGIKKEDGFVIALICLLLSSKMYETDHLNIDIIHRYTNHNYSSPQLFFFENTILELLDYDLLSYDQWPIKTSLSVSLFLVRPLLSSQKFLLLMNTSEIIFQMVISEEEAITEIFKEEENLVSAAIIFGALIVLTQSVGKFPPILRLQHTFFFSEDNLRLLTKKIMKIALGKEFYSSLDLG